MKLSIALAAAVLASLALSSLYNEIDLNHTCILRMFFTNSLYNPNLTC